MDEAEKRLRSESNVSDYDSDLEGEEDETFGSGGGTHLESGGGATDSGSQDSQRPRGAGRKRQLSDAAMAIDTQDLSPRESKGRQACILHNEREKERRKDLKQAVHRLRNQLQLHQTKKATTISVLKASEREIKDLVKMEDDQKRELTELETRNKLLTWQLNSLMSDQNREALSRSLTSSGNNSSSSGPILTPVLNPSPPSSFYIPGVVDTPSPSIPASPSFLLQPPRPSPPSTFPFGLQTPSLISSPYPLVSGSPHSGFPPAPRSLLFLPPISPQHFALPSFLPRFAATQSQFSFPSAPGTPPSHLPSPSSLLLQTFSPPGPIVPQPFPMFLAPPQSISHVTSASGGQPRDEQTCTPSPPRVLSPAPPGRRWRMSSMSLLHETSRNSPEALSPCCSQTLNEPLHSPTLITSQGRQGHTRDRRHSENTSDTLIDIESIDQETDEEGVEPFLGLGSPHRKQRKRHEKPDGLENSTIDSENHAENPAVSSHTERKNKISREDEREEESNATLTSNSTDHRILFKTLEMENHHRQREKFSSWKRKETSPSAVVLGLAPHLSTVICS